MKNSMSLEFLQFLILYYRISHMLAVFYLLSSLTFLKFIQYTPQTLRSQIFLLLLYKPRWFLPLSMGTLSIMLYKKRFALWKTASIFFKVAISSKLKFHDTVEVCIRLYLILQLLIVIQCFLTYYTFYKMSWISAVIVVMSNWSVNMIYYVILLGIFFQKFILNLLDECSRNKASLDEISKQMCLINDLLDVFNDACGQQLSFVLSTIIYFLITNVSVYSYTKFLHKF